MRISASILISIICLNACTFSDKPDTKHLSGNWQIRTLNKEPTPDTSARIRFDPTTHRYFAYFGCNQITGTYLTHGYKLQLSQPAGIDKLCPNIEDERTGTGTLSFINSWRIINDNMSVRLQLLDKNNYIRVEANLLKNETSQSSEQ